MQAPLLSPATRVLVFGSGLAGHEANAIGVAGALVPGYATVRVAPRPLFAATAPWGFVDPGDFARVPDVDIAIACGRVTVPYLRAIKRRSGGRTLTVFLQDPRAWRGTFDLIWVPEHDKLRGANVMTTAVSPHSVSPGILSYGRATPDPRLAPLPTPRVAMVLGGDSGAHRFEANDIAALAEIAGEIAASGAGLMVTASRRTPAALTAAIRAAVGAAVGDGENIFIWDGTGENPYRAMLALADSIIVTGDSVNMCGEACATGVPVHIYEPTGGSPKITRFIDGLVAHGAARRWAGQLESWSYAPLDATGDIAAEVARRYLAHHA
ncbi:MULTISPECIES: mitochondrial fission ELM1 family protein [unclassified Beijerinckia]|uniref:mitochondrial fission ELM1 family protein n=1 Tax=unclassified Beijerinckia TaxID=2638183 RepID=UPI00089AF8EB|nr:MULTISPECIES: mitochondrial fission ELM1 family protein [unclassified Beijerinckia]MDH7798613.1 mitochondrial fission protein ELM1 [Beijerinckia sp. GAS462]SED26717.1 hypothetical protein SAMN05443249_4912 [Beijerinckia sp. 28-YEA-48]